MARTDRRRTQRYELEIPLTIRTMDRPDAPVRSALCSNISATGLCLATDLPLNIGAPVEISLRMPEEVTGKPAQSWLCRGQVVRVAPDDMPNDKHSIGVAFQYYEVTDRPLAASRN